jgi:hypothetical protein
MLLSTKNGIVCDHCGISTIDKFKYYSFDIHEVIVKNNIIPASNNTAVPMFSFDICQHCMEDIKHIVIKCHKPTRITQGRCSQGMFCDLTSKHMHSNFTYYNVNISEVVVDIGLTPPTKIDAKYLELCINVESFEQFKTRAINLRKNKETQEWSSSSTQTQQ